MIAKIGAIALPLPLAEKMSKIFLGKLENADADLGYNQVVTKDRVKVLSDLAQSDSFGKLIARFGNDALYIEIPNVQCATVKVSDVITAGTELLKAIQAKETFKTLVTMKSLTGKVAGRPATGDTSATLDNDLDSFLESLEAEADETETA